MDHRIERLMRLQALKARPRRRRLPPDLGERQVAAVAPNVLNRSFDAPAPNRKWIADFTYVWTAEGWLYVAAVIDLFSRRAVGWSMSAEMTAQLVTDALVMAIWRRGKPDALLHHSDRGSQSGLKWSSQHPDEGGCDEDCQNKLASQKDRNRRAALLSQRPNLARTHFRRAYLTGYNVACAVVLCTTPMGPARCRDLNAFAPHLSGMRLRGGFKVGDEVLISGVPLVFVVDPQ